MQYAQSKLYVLYSRNAINCSLRSRHSVVFCASFVLR